MSKRSNPTLIGGFVVGAVALLALGVSVFGGQQLFARTENVVAYFPGSVKGLRVGSNVLFRGVRIGFVSNISLLGNIKTLDTVVRTELEITPGVWQFIEDGSLLPTDAIGMIDEDDFEAAGLRARLGIESVVTGQLVVELDLLPNTEKVYRALLQDDIDLEVPTIPSNTQQIVENLQTFIANLDLDELGKNIQGALQGMDELANSRELRDTFAGLDRLINNPDTQQLSGSLQATLSEVQTAAEDFGQLVENVDGQVGPILAEVKPAVERLGDALASAQDTLESVNRQIGGDTSLDWDLSTTLREVREAARSLRIFMDYLEQNPEALIRGKREKPE
ncbi:MAG: MlaD family protein [Gammaproteobacteria bacterium]